MMSTNQKPARIIMIDKIRRSAEFLKSEGFKKCDVLIITGTGLSGLMDDIDINIKIPYSKIESWPESTVKSHRGELIQGMLHDKTVTVMAGRFHYYEGYSFQEVVLPLRTLLYLGANIFIVTNAAGGVNDDYDAGDIMIIRDHINLMGGNPLRGRNMDELGPRFPSMLDAYSLKYMRMAEKTALANNIDIYNGVYCGLQGPSLETIAEYNMVKSLGADAVGMSTVPEVIAARHMGVDVLGISAITNIVNEKDTEHSSHDDVIENAMKAGEKIRRILRGFIKGLDFE
ncbi:MAG: purine-nucleoside phosphorylase [bacterium]